MKLGAKCRSYGNCVALNAACINRKCACEKGKVISEDIDPLHQSSVCLDVAEDFKDECKQHTQCTYNLKNSSCIQGKCLCLSDQHPFKNTCYKNIKLNEHCFNDPECFVDEFTLDDVKCKDNKCRCIGGKCSKTSCDPDYCSCERNEYRKGNKCIKLSTFYGTCSDDENCAPLGANCQNGKCVCDQGMILSDSGPYNIGQKCLKSKLLLCI